MIPGEARREHLSWYKTRKGADEAAKQAKQARLAARGLLSDIIRISLNLIIIAIRNVLDPRLKAPFDKIEGNLILSTVYKLKFKC